MELIKHATTPGSYPTREFLWWECHETQFVKQIIKPGMTCIDVGAKVGWYAMLCSVLAEKTGYVIAFEPLTEHYSKLLEYADQIKDTYKNASCIRSINNALSDKEETKRIKVSNTGGFTLIDGNEDDDRSQLVFFTTLDQFIVDWRGSILTVDFIKVDIDGHEVKFLRGAKKTIKKYQPLMMIEFGWPAKAVIGDDLNEGVDILEELGYTFYNVCGLHYTPDRKAENPFPIAVSSGINVVCVPKGQSFPKIELL